VIIGGRVEVQVSEDSADVSIALLDDNRAVIARAYIDQNQTEALETALRAARLELQARAVSL
jgi:hypothetical protein